MNQPDLRFALRQPLRGTRGQGKPKDVSMAQRHARIQVFDFIEGFYSPRRRHSALGYLSPERYEAATSIKIKNDQGAAAAA